MLGLVCNMRIYQFFFVAMAFGLASCAKTDHVHEEYEYEPPAAHEMIISAAEWGAETVFNPDVPFITQDLVDNAIILMYVYQGDATDTAPYSDYWGPVPSDWHEISYFDYQVGNLWLECEDEEGIYYDHLIRLVPVMHRDYAVLEEMGVLGDMDAVLEQLGK